MRTTSTRSVAIATVAAVAAVMLIAVFVYRSWSDDGSSEAPAIAGKSAAARADEGLKSLERKVQENPENTDAHLELANAYLQKAREYGDPSLYSAAENLLQRAEQLEPGNPEVFATQGILALSRHDFSKALELGQKALAIDPERARYWGVVADAQLELGMYEESIASLQEMVDRRPDFTSFSRVSHARELYGDIEGAIEAMQFAIESGSSSQPDIAWAYVQVGNLYLNVNNVPAASGAYEAALDRVPGYHGALAGQARIAAAANDLETAERLYAEAFSKVPMAEYAIALGDVYSAANRPADAMHQFALVRAIDQLSAANGVNTDLELALFNIDHGDDLSGSLARARAAYQARPSIHAADVLAWVLHRNGMDAEAAQYADEALKLGTRDPLKLYHAAVIFRALGEEQRAYAYLEEAVRLSPNFSLLYRNHAMESLAELRAAMLVRES